MRNYKNSIPDQLNWSPKTRNQLNLRDSIRKKRITIVTGTAGSGKTFVTVCVAFEELLSGRSNGIIVSRPIVPAGRDFGYLPGTLSDKLNPFMEPIWNTIIDLNLQSIQRLMDGEDSPVECVPLELMRGRTFTEKFIIIDEAQNATPKQIEMAMTRLGKDSRMVFTGDISQSDIRGTSGLAVALNIFKLEEEFGVVQFDLDDIQREGITRTVIERFDAFYKRNIK
jgi:phosphate starvation-inducible protein PhoH and related proteins